RRGLERVEGAVGVRGYRDGRGHHAGVAALPQQVHRHVPQRRQGPCRLPRRTRPRSSRKVSSRVWCRPFSIPQCARHRSNSRSASASSRLRLVKPYTTSSVVLPPTVRCRASRNTCPTLRPVRQVVVRPRARRDRPSLTPPVPLAPAGGGPRVRPPGRRVLG